MCVKNEDRFIWYAISSIMPFVDRFLITDTGSTDNTINIAKLIKNKKIEFKRQEISNASEIVDVRQSQIEKTKTDWFWIVDGDEIYPSSLCEEIVNIINKKGKDLEGIVVGRYDLLGDIYHYQDETVGSYNLFGKKGHLVLRLFNKKNIERLHLEGEYPFEGYYDKNNFEINNHDKKYFRFTKNKLFHAMYLQRSSFGANLNNTLHRSKWKIEQGHKINRSIIPEVFAQVRPVNIPCVSFKRSIIYELVAAFITPIKIMKRKIWKLLNI